MRYTIKYSEQNYGDGKPPKRYELKDLTREKARKVLDLLRDPIPGTLVKWTLYDENNKVIGAGDNRPTRNDDEE